MKKIFFLLSCKAFIVLNCFTQQSESLSNYKIDVLTNIDAFLNQKSINPAFLTDSNRISIDIILHGSELHQPSIKENGIIIKSETKIPSIKSSFGINIDFSNLGIIQYRSINIGYKYCFEISSNSKINVGSNIGFMHIRNDYSYLSFQNPDPVSTKKTDWMRSPIIDVGLSYQYKNHRLGLSYEIGDVRLIPDYQEHILKPEGLLSNYYGLYRISDKLLIIPELFGCYSEGKIYGITACSINLLNKLTGGILYNTKNSYGFLISGIIIKRIKLGYFYEIKKSDQLISYNHFNLGILLK